VAGVRVSRQGYLAAADRYERRLDPRNRPYYWSGLDLQRCDGHPEVDGTALHENFITITPVKCDMTDYDFLEALKQWDWQPAADRDQPGIPASGPPSGVAPSRPASGNG